ncbi:MAG: hypothetical protein M0Q43_01195 [Methanothrix sp.]|jgi:hypothetical protein|nr:hypothetical protein [Methanothrix sp.]
MAKISAVLFITILFGTGSAQVQSIDTATLFRHIINIRSGIIPGAMGRPITTSHILSGNTPTNVWWIGTHGDLPKTIAIARSGSSVRVYSNGLWKTP